jgi:hypothetical protein
VKNWHDVTIDIDNIDEIESMVLKFKDHNPACSLIDYWQERMYFNMMPGIKKDNKLVYGFVGDGWPIKSNQDRALAYDNLKLRNAFVDVNYRDVGDAIYQANKIIGLLKYTNDRVYILDMGSGYGRLAVPFLHHFKDKICYIGVDYSVMGILIAPQFISQTTNAKVRYYNDDSPIEDFQFVSLPAWRLDEIVDMKFNAFITIHSFQEMTKKTIEFYTDLANRTAAEKSIFYSINLPHHGAIDDGCGGLSVYEIDWNLISDELFPVNRDGNYFEKIWRK